MTGNMMEILAIMAGFTLVTSIISIVLGRILEKIIMEEEHRD